MYEINNNQQVYCNRKCQCHSSVSIVSVEIVNKVALKSIKKKCGVEDQECLSNRTKSIFLDSKFSFTLYRIHGVKSSQIFRSAHTGSQGSLKRFSSIKGRILHCLLFPRHKQPGARLQLLQKCKCNISTVSVGVVNKIEL